MSRHWEVDRQPASPRLVAVTLDHTDLAGLTNTYKVRVATRDSSHFQALVNAYPDPDHATYDLLHRLWIVPDNCVRFRVERNAAYRGFDDFDPVAYMTSLGLTVVEVVS